MINSVIVFQVISMEWGNFNSPHLPLTSYDASVDAESSNPGSQVCIAPEITVVRLPLL